MPFMHETGPEKHHMWIIKMMKNRKKEVRKSCSIIRCLKKCDTSLCVLVLLLHNVTWTFSRGLSSALLMMNGKSDMLY